MSMEQTEAIVLRTIEFSETSLVVTLLTRNFGRTSALAKGARRAKSPFEGSLDLLAVCRVVVLRKSSDALDLLTEAKLHRRFRAAERPGMSVDQRLQRLYAGYYVAEMIRHWTDDDQPHPELYDLTLQTILRIDGDDDLISALTFFDLQSLRLLGHAPGTAACVGCGGPVAEAGRIAFGLLAGGVLCAACRVRHRQTVWLRREVLQAIRDWGTAEAYPAIPLSAPIYGELRAVLNRYINGMLGRPPRMQHFLPSHAGTTASSIGQRTGDNG